MSLNESIVEDAALEWFGELGYAVRHGPHLAPGEPAAERDSFSEVLLVGRLREALRRLNPAIPEEAREEALRKVLRVGTPSLTQTNRAFHKMLRDGVPVEYPRPDGSIAGDHVRLVDFNDVRANDWLAGGEPVHRDRGAAQPATGHRGLRQRAAARPDRAEERGG
ncbi:MAG: type I restriction endonuclease [Candidatus Competibacteraceae bacterium]